MQEDIFNEFSSGNNHPMAVRRFLKLLDDRTPDKLKFWKRGYGVECDQTYGVRCPSECADGSVGTTSNNYLTLTFSDPSIASSITYNPGQTASKAGTYDAFRVFSKVARSGLVRENCYLLLPEG